MIINGEEFVPFNPFRNTTQSVVNISSNGLNFNVKTADVLHHTPYVQILLNSSTRRFAVQAATDLSPDSTQFFRPEVFKTNRIKINSKPLVKRIREIAGWTEDEIWNVAGVYSEQDDAIIYDLDSAYKPSNKGGWASGRRKQKYK